MKTRIKLALVNILIFAGSLAIIWFQWPDAIKTHSYGHGFEPSSGSATYLAVLLTGIPVVLYAVAVHVAATQSHWLFAPGELKDYRARQLLKTMKPASLSRAESASPAPPADAPRAASPKYDD